MTPKQCEAAFDRFIEATNYMEGGGLGGYKWALSKLLNMMDADWGANGDRVLRECGLTYIRQAPEREKGPFERDLDEMPERIAAVARAAAEARARKGRHE